MTVTSSGIKCDVCGDYIIGLFDDDMVYPFKLSTFKNTLHGCKSCIDIIHKLDGKGEEAWKELPEGPLKKAYADIAKKMDTPAPKHSEGITTSNKRTSGSELIDRRN